jgi:hypothetical protein
MCVFKYLSTVFSAETAQLLSLNVISASDQPGPLKTFFSGEWLLSCLLALSPRA